jgi:hypothetical protein
MAALSNAYVYPAAQFVLLLVVLWAVFKDLPRGHGISMVVTRADNEFH